jgi:hypothetical protein
MGIKKHLGMGKGDFVSDQDLTLVIQVKASKTLDIDSYL